MDNRFLIALLVPLAAAAVTGLIIVSIGSLLLSIGAETMLNLGLFDISAPVVVALLIAVVVLLGATILDWMSGRTHRAQE